MSNDNDQPTHVNDGLTNDDDAWFCEHNYCLDYGTVVDYNHVHRFTDDNATYADDAGINVNNGTPNNGNDHNDTADDDLAPIHPDDDSWLDNDNFVTIHDPAGRVYYQCSARDFIDNIKYVTWLRRYNDDAWLNDFAEYVHNVKRADIDKLAARLDHFYAWVNSDDIDSPDTYPGTNDLVAAVEQFVRTYRDAPTASPPLADSDPAGNVLND